MKLNVFLTAMFLLFSSCSMYHKMFHKCDKKRCEKSKCKKEKCKKKYEAKKKKRKPSSYKSRHKNIR